MANTPSGVLQFYCVARLIQTVHKLFVNSQDRGKLWRVNDNVQNIFRFSFVHFKLLNSD